MKIITDTNKLFSAALSKNGKITQTLFSDEYDFIVPHFTMVELFKYKDKLILSSEKQVFSIEKCS
jgi:predicted nucleic acid-binding protein